MSGKTRRVTRSRTTGPKRQKGPPYKAAPDDQIEPSESQNLEERDREMLWDDGMSGLIVGALE